VFMRMDIHENPSIRVEDERMLLEVVRCSFAMRRKTLVNNLRAAFSLSKSMAMDCVLAAGLPPEVRGERVDLAGFAAVTEALRNMKVNKANPSK